MTNCLEIIVLDIDGSVVHQERLLTRYHPAIIPLRQQEESLRFFCQPSEIAELRKKLVGSSKTNQGKLILIGSGDYHHLALLGISVIQEPFTLIQFDNHTDFWKPLKNDFYDFGSWVLIANHFSNLRKVIQLGVDGDLRLAWYLPFLQGRRSHDLDNLFKGKIEVYPNRIRHSILAGKFRHDLGFASFHPGLFTTKVSWNNMKDSGGVADTVMRLIPTIPTEGVYLTIDKDVMRESENFSAYPGRQGTLTLDELIEAISIIGENKRIIGADICGDGSHTTIKHSLGKRLLQWQMDWSLPSSIFSSPDIVQRNERVNMEIIEQFNRCSI